jgi:hypothetical protein
MEIAYTFLVGKPKRTHHSEDIGIDRIILEWMLNKYEGESVNRSQMELKQL